MPYGLDQARSRNEPIWIQHGLQKRAIGWEQMLEAGMEREMHQLEKQKQDLWFLVGQYAATERDSTLAAVNASVESKHRLRVHNRYQQLQFIFAINQERVTEDRFSSWPESLRDLLPLWYADLSRDWVKSYTQRSAECQTLLQRFLCVIPKARSTPASSWYSYPDRSVLRRARERAHRQQQMYEARNAMLWTAEARSRLYFPDRRLIQFDCGKLQTLAVLLRRLQRENHRVLIFTQMSRVLDVLEEFLNIHGYHYLRLDGSTKADARQALMQRFNHDRRIFAFILSTRSGGVGVNLTGADTVIFYDSDWNPAMDKQAQDRCHRIGQTREVNIYRLVTKYTIEENILKKSEEKRHLDFLAIQSGDFNLQFLQRLDPTDIIDEAVDAGISVEDVKTAMRNAEDEMDAEAAKVVEQETAAELAEFTQEATVEESDEDKDTEQKSDSEETAKSEPSDEEQSMGNERIQALLESCSAIERYAIRFMEQALHRRRGDRHCFSGCVGHSSDRYRSVSLVAVGRFRRG